eukprot:s1388_g13.t2
MIFLCQRTSISIGLSDLIRLVCRWDLSASFVPCTVEELATDFNYSSVLKDQNAVEIPSGSPYLIAGYKSCEPEAMALPPRCRTETPGNGFPGYSGKSSDLAWPGGKQPYSLECWPKRWDGAPLACTQDGFGGLFGPMLKSCGPCQINVLEDTKNGWPGKCRGLVEIKGVNGTDCGRDCRSNPSCQSWQNTVYYSCWQGLGKDLLRVSPSHAADASGNGVDIAVKEQNGDCFVRSNFVPREAQRLQHGSIRVLKDLTGYQIKGLTKGFDNAEGFFQKQEDAIIFCKNMCYSDIRCQYWLYAPNYGCYLEDASQDDGPPYPLTVHAAMRDTGFAKELGDIPGPTGMIPPVSNSGIFQDCVAGEYIQHYCPAESVSRVRQMPLPILADCAERGYRYEPPSMFLSHRSVEPNWEACRSRCKLTVYCNYFAFWPDGGCLVAGTDSQRVVAESYEDKHLLEGRYADAIAKTIGVPVTQIKEGPDNNDLDAQVHLSPSAYTPNEPVTSRSPAVLASKLKVPALITNLKVATTQAQLPVMALEGGQIQVGEPQVGFLFVHYFANQADPDDGKRKRLRVSGRGVSDEDAVELPLKEGLE